MAEAEDVIVDAARHATSYAMDLWRRNRPPDSGPPKIALADVRARLELLLEGAFGRAFPIRPAYPPRPATLLERLMRRDERAGLRPALPATDGAAVYLPRELEGEAHWSLERYRVAALHQAYRCVRGSAAAYPRREPRIVGDLFLMSELKATQHALAALLPGVAAAMAHMRARLLSERPPRESGAEPLRAVESLYRALLAGNDAMPIAGTPRDSLAWARAVAAELPRSATRYRGLPSDLLLGEVVEREAAASSTNAPAAHGEEEARRTRVARLDRRPRSRGAADDEDDAEPGVWMIQSSPPNEHAEDPMGLQRPVDQEPDADLPGSAESVADLEALRLVSTPGTPREAFSSDDLPPVAAARPVEQGRPALERIAYPEWDYLKAGYVERAAIVRELAPQDGSAAWVDATLARNRVLLARVQRRFEALRSRRSIERAQPAGDDVDIEAYVGGYSDKRARLPRTDRLYLAYPPARRDFALLILADVSGSTEAWVSGGSRIIDLEKEALLIVSMALHVLRVRFAVQAFSGHGPSNVRVRPVKAFAEPFTRPLARRIAALEPEDYTRAGAALRHAAATLLREPAHRRLLLLLSDGKPNDYDRYEGRYGFEDTRQALAEARLQGIAPFCVTVDRNASRHLAPLFGAGHYTIVRDAPQLATALLEWLRSVTVALL
jgi:nitric oxide reductase NorD protein